MCHGMCDWSACVCGDAKRVGHTEGSLGLQRLSVRVAHGRRALVWSETHSGTTDIHSDPASVCFEGKTIAWN